MREFTNHDIECYATRAQASAALAAAINGLQGIAGLDIFTHEEQEDMKAALNTVLEVARFNDARIKVFEEALTKYQAVKPSQKALVNLINLLDGLRHESENDNIPATPIKEGTDE